LCNKGLLTYLLTDIIIINSSACCGCAEDFALSVHDGLTSVSPVLATVWGTNVARSSVEDRCFYSNGTVPPERHSAAWSAGDTCRSGRR